MTIAKTFDPAAIEARWYAHWEAEGRFRPARPEAEPFTIVIPPPNVTGSLHIGHALDNTLQDILVRHARLKGKDALWVVGTDHAGIATQMVVERNLAAQGVKRAELGREAFVEKVWQWKEESGGAITRQLRRLGASCDWANERFTMDEGFSKAVVRVFVELHRQGLLYRDKRLVNWDPFFRTAISDLEVETKEEQGGFWHFRYPLADGGGAISVATTRPETMLADMMVAVHPDDDRYRAMVGKQVRLPITGRLIPIVADEHADPALGSGAVKITPGHDFNDFEVGRRAGLKAGDMLNMLDAEARVVQTADGRVPADLIGLTREDARAAVVARTEADGLLERVEQRTIQRPYGDRSGVVIEPWLTDQWYVDAKTLAGPALEAVRSGAIRVVPETWKKTWYQWLENIQPWCVSRQLWWGHQIPAWYGPPVWEADGQRHHIYLTDELFKLNKNRPEDEQFFVAETEAEVVEVARRFYISNRLQNPKIVFAKDREEARRLGDGSTIALFRDSDVLDTWFSSALWPFATLGWPDGANPPRHGEGDQPQAGGGGSLSGTRQAARPLHHASHGPPPRAGEDHGNTLLARHYPNDVLVSGFDILFFWDARMAMQGLHFMKEVPWRTLYLHGLVRAPDGSKMSKSKGNTVDPLGLIDRYGADALRFTLAAMESQGRDIKLDEKRVEGYRNFATKLWNAARFAQGQGIGASTTLEPPPADLAVNGWIVAETIRTVQTLDLALADLRFDEAANTIYHFVWSRFCDWYLELIKPALGAEIDAETKAVAGWVLDQILVMLHPFMPFVTEELWHALGGRDYDLILAKWPMADARAIDPAVAAEVEWLISTITAFRTFRAELAIPYAVKLSPKLTVRGTKDEDLLDKYQRELVRLVGLNRIMVQLPGRLPERIGAEGLIAYTSEGAATISRDAAQIIVGEAIYVVPLEGVIDLTAERTRLAKGVEAAVRERDALAKRLDNPAFVEKARPEAVAKAREDHAAKAAEAERSEAALKRLG